MTNSNTIPERPVDIDTKALSDLIIELNISRRNMRAYPSGHKIIEASLEKALTTHAILMSTREEIIIGIARDALLINENFLDRKNQVYRDFARVLYERGIGALVIRRGLTIHELKDFVTLLGMKREEIISEGGVERIWLSCRASSLGIKEIRYDLFSTTEGVRSDQDASKPLMEGLWERFARGLTQGTLSPDGSPEGCLSPEFLAETINRRINHVNGQEIDYAAAIVDFLRGSDSRQAAGVKFADSTWEKLATFVSKLKPELRRQFLSGAFDLSEGDTKPAVESFIGHLSADAVLETLEDINRDQMTVPPAIIGLLHRFSQHSRTSRQTQETDFSDPVLREKMRIIFREHAAEEHIPGSYQIKLDKIIDAKEIPLLKLGDEVDIQCMVDGFQLEKRISEILLFLLDSPSNEDGDATLAKSFVDMCAYFVQTGDFRQVGRIVRQVRATRLSAGTRNLLNEYLSQREFLDEILNGLACWGKVKFEEIGDLIEEIGEPFVEVLLDRLAEEDSRPIRRFIMDRLLMFGTASASAITERLTDNRWYYLRNLVCMVRTLKITSAAEKLKPLAHHPNQRVRQESRKTLLLFRDQEIEIQVIRDMESKDRETQLGAIHVAEESTSPAIFQKMLSLLMKPGLSSDDGNVKCALIQTLAHMGNVDAVPKLAELLGARSFFHSGVLNRIKMEIIRSLERYPAQSARPILETIAAGKGDLAQQAALSLLAITLRHS